MTALQHAVRVVSANPQAAAVSHVVLRLDPPGIGTIAVRLASHAGEVSVAIRTDSPQAANAVAATREQVIQALAGHGLSLGDVRVSTGGTDTGSSSQPGGNGHHASAGGDSGSSTAAGFGAAGSGDAGDRQSRSFRFDTDGPASTPVRQEPTTNDQPATPRPRREGTWL